MTTPLEPQFARHFAREWIEAWNQHDLDRILSHYSDEFEMNSPFISQMLGFESGQLKGKAAVRAYWAAALERFVDLKFDLLGTLLGVDSVALVYRGVTGGLVTEIFTFDSSSKVRCAHAHYEVAPSTGGETAKHAA